ncbi:hypothetical protein CDEF62S_00482 [Castellaniella defragrans]
MNDTLNGVLGQALPDLMPAASGGTIIPIVVAEPAASGSGRNVQVIEPLVGGTGGRHGSDGADGRDSSISNLANNPVETVEAEVGVQILRYGLRPDSGGPGQWRGGCGQEIVFRILQDESTLLARGMERLRFQPWGAQGGEAGASTRLLLNAGTPRERTLGKIDTLAVQAGDEITLQGPGGGGWGDPMQRPPEAVMNDVRNGLVSVESARARYGVAVEAGGRLDQQETARLRQQPRHDGDVSARLGLAREHWDAAFECPLLDRLNRALFALPVERRARQRKLALDAAMANLPRAFRPRRLRRTPSRRPAAPCWLTSKRWKSRTRHDRGNPLNSTDSPSSPELSDEPPCNENGSFRWHWFPHWCSADLSGKDPEVRATRVDSSRAGNGRRTLGAEPTRASTPTGCHVVTGRHGQAEWVKPAGRRAAGPPMLGPRPALKQHPRAWCRPVRRWQWSSPRGPGRTAGRRHLRTGPPGTDAMMTSSPRHGSIRSHG